MSREPTEHEAQAFCDHMAHHHGFRFGDKSKAPEMALVAQFLPRLGVKITEEDFLRRFSTTVGTYVYLADALTPWQRIVVCTHEAIHVEQCRKALGWLAFVTDLAVTVADAEAGLGDLAAKLTALLSAFSWGYLTSLELRAADEARAYQAQQHLGVWRAGAPEPLDALCEHLTHYGLGPPEGALCRAMLSSSEASARAQVVPPGPIQTALAYLDAHLADVREPSAPSDR